MIPVLKNRLEEIQNKFLEIESKLLDTAIDPKQRLILSKEHAELSPIVESINSFNTCTGLGRPDSDARQPLASPVLL